MTNLTPPLSILMALSIVAGCKNREVPVFERFAHPKGLFSIEAPKEWRIEADDETCSVLPPRKDVDPDRPRFLLIDFQRGRDGDADHFIEGFSVDPGPYEKIGKIESISIDGRPAKRFVVNQARRQLHGPLVPGEENVDYVVIPVEKGYFVLSYTAHINDFQKGRPAFEHLLQTFHHPAKAAK